MLLVTALLAALLAGVIQGVTGFGAGIVMMSILPYVTELTSAAAMTALISIVLTSLMVWRYRASLNLKVALLPTLFYIAGSTLAIRTVQGIDITMLKLVFGVFLIALALYFAFAKSVSLAPNLVTMFVCGFVSGLCDGFFSVGGPLMVLFFMAVTTTREEYLANLQVVFLVVAAYNTVLRAATGLFTADLVAPSLAGMAGIFLGLQLANRIADRIDDALVRNLTYLLIGVSGVITLVTTALTLL